MIFDIKPMIFPPRNVGREFVCKVLVAGLLSQLDAGAPYNGWILGGGLWFDSGEEAEKIPVGFNSDKSLVKVNKDGNVANGAQAHSSKEGHGKKNKRGGPDPVRQNGKM
jgi:hypothetical protein